MMKRNYDPATPMLESEVAQSANSPAIVLEGAHGYSAVSEITVTTPAAKTFDSKSKAVRIVQDLTYTADSFGAAGNSVTIAYVAGGTAGAEVVTLVGTAISVSMETTVSTANQIKTAIEASAPAAALVDITVSGNGATAQVAATAIALAGGRDSELELTANTIGIPAHGLATGLKGQLTTTTTLPTGLSLATDYFVIVVDAATIKLATSLALAIAGTGFDITGEGAGVHTFTSTAIAGGTVKLQASIDGVVFVDVADSSSNVTATANFMWNVDAPYYKYFRIAHALTAGQVSIKDRAVVWGE